MVKMSSEAIGDDVASAAGLYGGDFNWLLNELNTSTANVSELSLLHALMANLTVAAAVAVGNADSSTADTLQFQYYAWGVIGNVIAAFGVVGNILSIIVLSSRRMRSPTALYLIALSVFDLVVLVSLILFMALPVINFATGHLAAYQRFYPYLMPFAYPIALTAQTCSIYTTVGFTVERFTAVRRPLHTASRPGGGRRRAWYTIAVVVVTAILYNVPRMLEYRVTTVFDSHTNQTVVTYGYTSFGADARFRHAYFIYLHLAVMLVVPFALLASLNALLVRALRASRRITAHMTRTQKRENNLSGMLVAVVVVFLICQVPSIVDNIVAAVLPPERISSPPFVKLTCVSSLMVIANSAANFYLYCVFGRKFRRVFCHICCTCYVRARKPPWWTDGEKTMSVRVNESSRRNTAALRSERRQNGAVLIVSALSSDDGGSYDKMRNETRI